MKKFFAFAVALIASVSMFAQSETGSITIVPKVGVNLATVTGDGDQKMKVDFAIGAEAAYQLTDKFAVSGGLLYSGQGAKDGDDNMNLGYLNVPILANYYVMDGLAIKAGIQPGFLLSAKMGSHDIKSNCESLDFSIPVGVSYEISKIVVDARYNFGLTKIGKHGDGKNSVIQVSVGYKF